MPCGGQPPSRPLTVSAAPGAGDSHPLLAYDVCHAVGRLQADPSPSQLHLGGRLAPTFGIRRMPCGRQPPSRPYTRSTSHPRVGSLFPSHPIIPPPTHYPQVSSLSPSQLIIPGSAHYPRVSSLSPSQLIIPGSVHYPRVTHYPRVRSLSPSLLVILYQTHYPLPNSLSSSQLTIPKSTHYPLIHSISQSHVSIPISSMPLPLIVSILLLSYFHLKIPNLISHTLTHQPS
jgi:hypothetical protein